MITLPSVLALLSAYLVGSIPFSFLIARAKGVDLRKTGSGNVGATNVARTCGPVAGTLAYVLDIGKGVAAGFLVEAIRTASGDHGAVELVYLFAFFLAPVGHLFPVWLRFKGGKGVAASAGVLLPLFPVPLVLILAGFLVTFLATRIISISSIVAALLVPVSVWLHRITCEREILGSFLAYRSIYQERHFPSVFLLSTGLAAFIIYKHRSNISRLLKGEEHRFRK